MKTQSEIESVFEPRKSFDPIKTISDLAHWLRYECVNGSYGIGQVAYEGFVIKRKGKAWHWCFSERGNSRIIEAFDCEEKIVCFAYDQIRSDPWAWTHCVGFFKKENEAIALKETLQARGLSIYNDKIPYGGTDDPRYRVFVFGRDSLEFDNVDTGKRTAMNILPSAFSQ